MRQLPGNPSLESLRRTNLPGYYSNDYDYADSAHNPNGIDYLIPTQAGLIESKVIPLLNPVDRYYATHTVNNGQVRDNSASYRMALSTPHFVNPDGTRGALATVAETYDNKQTAQQTARQDMRQFGAGISPAATPTQTTTNWTNNSFDTMSIGF